MDTPHDPKENDRGMIAPAQGESAEELQEGIGICLSGGGYRAMLFHVGALWRLNETGILAKAERISSVSGGSITAAWLALTWKNLRSESGGIPADAFRDVFAFGLRRLASHTIDIPSVLRGLVPWRNVGREVANAYDRLLFRRATLQELPVNPRFVFNASNLQTGALWRFSRDYMADWKVGQIMHPQISLATAVAASSAFPPVLSPIELSLHPEDYEPKANGPMHRPPFNTRPILSDGGVYDNLGLEPVLKNFRTVLASDGGSPFRVDPTPSRCWPFQVKRVLDCIDNQVRALRRRDLIECFKTRQRTGCYWGIGTPMQEYAQKCGLEMTSEVTARLAQIPTRLARMVGRLQEQLINWGYAACAASLATHFQEGSAVSWPYPHAIS